MPDARHQPAGPPAPGETLNTAAVQAAVAKIKAKNAEDKAARRSRR
jgi:hypothetical protein